MSRVIAVSGPSGAGKTILLELLADRLKPSSVVSYEEYYQAPCAIPSKLSDWIKGGCEPSRFISIPRLVRDMSLLRSGLAVTSPAGTKIAPAETILMEEPWGRQRSEIASCIDVVVHIDLPPELALARKLTREAAAGLDPMSFLADYLELEIWRIYRAQANAKYSADLVVDGMLSPEGMLLDALQGLRAFDGVSTGRGD